VTVRSRAAASVALRIVATLWSLGVMVLAAMSCAGLFMGGESVADGIKRVQEVWNPFNPWLLAWLIPLAPALLLNLLAQKLYDGSPPPTLALPPAQAQEASTPSAAPMPDMSRFEGKTTEEVDAMIWQEMGGKRPKDS
jgi:hypothetical protein